MSAAGSCAAAIRRVGGTAYLLRDGERMAFTASIQPVLRETDESASALGWGFARRFHLYAPCGGRAEELQPGDTILYRSARYLVRQVERADFGGEGAYIWAALQMEEAGG